MSGTTKTSSGKTTKRKRSAKPKMVWVSLHNHTTFSYGDGYGPVADHVDRVRELGMTAVAATEHGNMSSHAQLEKACKANEKTGAREIQPIYGVEAYCGPTDPEDPWRSVPSMKWHLIIIAMNQTGYVNLCRIVTASWRDNHSSRYPTVSAAMLKEWSEGLIVLSGCSDSHLSTTLLGGKSLGEKRLTYTEEDYQNAKKVALWYRSVFGDRYYIEVQRFPRLERTCVLNPAFERISEETGIPLVATADVHYPKPEQNKMQAILHSAHRGKTVYQSESSWEYDILLTYPTSDQEIFEDLIDTGLSGDVARRAIHTSADIARRCKVVLPKNEPIRWEFDRDKYANITEYLWDKLREGWDFRAEYNENMPGNEEFYVARLKYEMGMISAKEFENYFAMVAYLLVWAKEQKIAIGPARGSAAASLVCYMLRITEIDPMQFPTMLFSRFIDPNRFDLPDIDVDVQDDRRHEVIEEARRVFGADRVANIGNFIKYRGKNSIDDITAVYRLPSEKAEDLKKLIVDRSGGDARQDDSLADTFAMFPKAREILKEYPKFKLATKLEGNYRGLGKHAAGLVISNAPIDETCAVYGIEGKMDPVVAYDKKDADYVGMLKMDLLGLKTMGMIGLAIDTIGMDLEDLYRVPITEERTLRAFYENDLNGIFQFEGRATAIVNNDVKPETFQQLADINALSRPGPLFSGMEAQYVAVKHGYEPAEKLHPVVDALTDWTYGQIVYQEQVLSILSELAGFSAIRVGDIRRIISQKSGMMAMQNAYQEFEDGCRTKHGIKSDLAKKIWNFIATSSTYSFNQSHSVSYAMLAFWCMYLKQYHPTAFYAAQLTKVGDGKATLWKRGRLMADAMRGNPDTGREPVSVMAPDLMTSGHNWTANLDTKSVHAGFMQVYGIGPSKSEALLTWRDSKLSIGHTVSWSDIQEVHGFGPATAAKIEAFVNKDDPFDIELTGRVLTNYRQRLQLLGREAGIRIPGPTHHSTELPDTGTHKVVWIGMARKKNFKDAVEAERARTGKEEDEIIAGLKDPHLRKSCVVQAYDEGEEDVYLRFSRWVYPELEEDLEELQLNSDVIIVAGKKREGFGKSINVEHVWVIDTSEDETEEDEEMVGEHVNA